MAFDPFEDGAFLTFLICSSVHKGISSAHYRGLLGLGGRYKENLGGGDGVGKSKRGDSQSALLLLRITTTHTSMIKTGNLNNMAGGVLLMRTGNGSGYMRERAKGVGCTAGERKKVH